MGIVLEKSWLFEIVDKKSRAIKESFTLLLPPTAITVKEPQRVMVQKTFGNVHIDDYGADNIQITLKAFSGMAKKMPTFKTTGTASSFPAISESADTYTGIEAFKEFRNNIMRYRSKYKDQYDKYDMYVYDFEHSEAYVCLLLDFTLDRSADKPLRYPFTISLLVIKPLAMLFQWGVPEKLSAHSFDIDTAIKNINNAADALDEIFTLQNTIATFATLNGDNPVIKAMNLLSAVNNYGQRFVAGINTVKNQIAGIKWQIGNFVNDVQGIVEFPANAIKVAANTLAEIVKFPAELAEQFDNTLEAYADMVNHLKRTYTSVSRAYMAAFNITSTKKDVSVYPTDTGEPNTVATESANTAILSAGVDSAFLQNTTSSEITIYNSKATVVITEGMTLAAVANMLGLPDWIAMANDLGITNDDLYPGLRLTVPIQVPQSASLNTFILNSEGLDIYGSDLSLDDSGNFVVWENGELAILNNVDNVKKAVDRRLKTSIGSLVTHTAYGLSISAGSAGTVVAIRYLQMTIEATILADPRIVSVSNLSIKILGDTIEVGCDLHLASVISTDVIQYAGSV